MNRNSLAFVYAALVAFASVMLAVWIYQGGQPNNNFLDLLPKDQQRPWVQQVLDEVSEDVETKLILVVNGDDFTQVKAATDELSQELSQSLELMVTDVDDIQSKIGKSLFDYRYQLLDNDTRNGLQNDGAPEIAQRAITQIYSPFAGVSFAELDKDPFLLFRHYLTHAFAEPRFSAEQGYLVRHSGSQVQILLQAQLMASPYQREQQQLIAQLNQRVDDIAQQYGVDVWRQGAAFYVTDAASSAQFEVAIIGGGSLVAIVIIMLLLFRSPQPLALCLLTIYSAITMAAAVTWLWFGQIHGFTLVVGASLIGISVDYAFHYICYRSCAGAHWHPKTALKHMQPVLLLGMLSSCFAFAVMIWGGFPGLKQVAVFCSVGLAGALASVLLLYPLFTETAAKTDLSALGDTLVNGCNNYRRSVISRLAWLLVVVISGYGLTLVSFNDDVRAMQSLSSQLKQEETLIANATGVSPSQQWLVIVADTQEQALTTQEQLMPQLQALQQQGVLSRFVSLGQLLPSQAQQQQNYRLSQYLLASSGEQLAAQLGLSTTPQLPPFKLLTWEVFSYLKADLPFLFGSLSDGRSYVVVTLQGVQDIAAIEALQQQSAQVSVSYVARADEISTLLSDYRNSVLELLLVALLAVFTLLASRYGLLQGARLLLAPVLACGFAIALPAIAGLQANLFSLLGLLIVFGVGVDYSLILNGHRNQGHGLLTVILAGITTLLAFGIMAFSSNNAIASFGLTIACGIFAAWVLAPQPQRMKHVAP
ncbi:MMPL family transporter [Paraferrimonas haliotis]|uniref:Membrane protein n=1 Tax=Paraferrimonas haliotis TaxID=2013866 RepID=A0AA37WXY8_9GAMM|nr:MMPL family transporter [Paraferrimonas haliotis]GLS83165.1 membrane protein [Paraferrimonas haliotis]